MIAPSVAVAIGGVHDAARPESGPRDVEISRDRGHLISAAQEDELAGAIREHLRAVEREQPRADHALVAVGLGDQRAVERRRAGDMQPADAVVRNRARARAAAVEYEHEYEYDGSDHSFFTNEVITGLLANSLETAALGEDGFYDVGEGPGSDAAAEIDWLTISDQAQAVIDDVLRIKQHPLVPSGIPVHGLIYDVRSGRLLDVPGAEEAGRVA